jgi:hypothetical protein
MSNIRFLDQVPLASFQSSAGNSTGNGDVVPSVILPGTTFTISSNTSAAVYRLTVAGTLNVESGPEVELPDGSVVYAHGQLFVDDKIIVQGTVNNDGLIVVGGDL